MNDNKKSITCSEIMNTNIKNFDENKGAYQLSKNRSASIFKKMEFITGQENFSLDELTFYNKMIDRKFALTKLSSELFNLNIAIELEAGIFEFSIVYKKMMELSNAYIPSIYADKLKDIIVNLNSNSSVQNKTLKEKLFKQELNAQEIPFMTPDQLHPERWKKQIKKKELKEYKKNNMAATDIFKCYKCGERKCKITQMQIRSADEPMTNIVKCLICYHVWKC
jgi:transcription elongation factor S-II